MVSRDRRLALGLAGLAVLYLIGGRRYPLDTLATPGPGIFPLVAGLALLLVAGWLFARAEGSPGGGPAGAVRWSRSALAIGVALVLYAALLPLAGFVAVSLALVVVTARLMGLPGWWRPLVLGAGVVTAARLVFVSWLGVPLP